MTLAHLARRARLRRVADDGLTGLPLVVAAAAIGWRTGGASVAIPVAVAGLAAVGAAALRRVRRLDRAWLVRRLDRDPACEDSADLLFAAPPTALARLQRVRVARRLADAPPDLRPPWSWRRIGLAAALGALVTAAILAWPRARPAALAPADEGVRSGPGVPRLVGQRLRVVPPAYTGRAAYAAGLDVRAPQGSRLDWTLSFAPQPHAATLAFAGGGSLALTPAGGTWTARRVLDRSLLYRVVPSVPAGAPLPRLHRLDAVADAPPTIRVLAPDRGLSLVASGQRRWALAFAATDDYGVAPLARLHLTVAEGEGESVRFRETVVAVRGTGAPRDRRFAVAVDLAALKFTAGSDLVAQLVVDDNRVPAPQAARSPSLILRWPAATGDGAGMAGVVTRALPAYFRSERQIIIDAEALLRARPHLTAAEFLSRSDAIGADQRLLRLRYGQFLGEEQEGRAPPTADAGPPVADDGTTPRPAFGSETDTLADYGHVHDEAEAATLLDPDTRTKLKGALDAMWQAELHLREGAPQPALPFAHTALGLIKQVQQATRIFLARVGPDLPSLDETRRLTGRRDGLGHRALAPLGAMAADAPAAAWAALAAPAGPPAADLAALDRWLRALPENVVDPLAVTAALDAVRREPGCAACRRTLQGLVWRALPRPAPQGLRRAGGDAGGRRYLDALAAAR